MNIWCFQVRHACSIWFSWVCLLLLAHCADTRGQGTEQATETGTSWLTEGVAKHRAAADTARGRGNKGTSEWRPWEWGAEHAWWDAQGGGERKQRTEARTAWFMLWSGTASKKPLIIGQCSCHLWLDFILHILLICKIYAFVFPSLGIENTLKSYYIQWLLL